MISETFLGRSGNRDIGARVDIAVDGSGDQGARKRSQHLGF